MQGYGDYNFVSDGRILAGMRNAPCKSITLFQRQGGSYKPVHTFRFLSWVHGIGFAAAGLFFRTKADMCRDYEMGLVDMKTLNMRKFRWSPEYPHGDTFGLVYQCGRWAATLAERDLAHVPWEDIIEVRGSADRTTAVLVHEQAIVTLDADEDRRQFVLTMKRPRAFARACNVLSETRVGWMCTVARVVCARMGTRVRGHKRIRGAIHGE